MKFIEYTVLKEIQSRLDERFGKIISQGDSHLPNVSNYFTKGDNHEKITFFNRDQGPKEEGVDRNVG
jgi:hypothetical protein